MDRREIIEVTLNNLESIYKDVGGIIRTIEEKLKNSGLKALGDSAATWENSSAYTYPEGWLNTFFARAYVKDNTSRKVVGFCIHLGKNRIDPGEIDKFEAYNLQFPFIVVTYLELPSENLSRSMIYDFLWGGGMYGKVEKVIGNKIVHSNEAYNSVKAKEVSYYLDLLKLTNGEEIDKLVVLPMLRMYEGNLDYVDANNLDVIYIETQVAE